MYKSTELKEASARRKYPYFCFREIGRCSSHHSTRTQKSVGELDANMHSHIQL